MHMNANGIPKEKQCLLGLADGDNIEVVIELLDSLRNVVFVKLRANTKHMYNVIVLKSSIIILLRNF